MLGARRLRERDGAAADDTERQLRADTVITAVTGLGVYGMSAITGPLLARALGPAGRGDLAAVLVPSELLGWALLFGLHMAAIYYADEYPHRELVVGAWAFALVVGGAIVGVGWWLVPRYLHGHPHETIPWLRVMLIVAVVFVPATTALHLLRSTSMMAFNVFKSMQLVIESVIIVVLAAVGHLTLTTALWAALLSQVVWYLALFAYAKAWPGTRFRWSTLRVQLSYGSRLLIGDLSGLAVTRLDQFILVDAVASSKLGEYAVAATASMVTSAAAGGIAFVMFPAVRRARTPEESWEAMLRGVRWTLCSSSALALLIAVAAPIGIPLLFGHAFHGAVRLLWLLLPGQVAFDVGGAVSQKAMADNRPGAVSRAMAIAGVVTVVGLAITVRPWGIVGAALVTSASQFAFLAYLWVAVSRVHRAIVARSTPTA